MRFAVRRPALLHQGSPRCEVPPAEAGSFCATERLSGHGPAVRITLRAPLFQGHRAWNTLPHHGEAGNSAAG